MLLPWLGRMTKTFTQTSNLPYDKHQYAIIANDGSKLVFDDYMEVYKVWAYSDGLSHVEVLDRIESTKKSVKGFGNAN